MGDSVAERLQALAARQGVRRLCLAYDAADGWQASIDYGSHGSTGGRCETPEAAVYSLEAWLGEVDDEDDAEWMDRVLRRMTGGHR